MNLVSVKILDC